MTFVMGAVDLGVRDDQVEATIERLERLKRRHSALYDALGGEWTVDSTAPKRKEAAKLRWEDWDKGL